MKRILLTASLITSINLLLSAAALAADERTGAFIRPYGVPHGELRFIGKVTAISPKTHTIYVLQKAETKPFVVDDKTKLMDAKGRPFLLGELKKGNAVQVLYSAHNGV
ncbi:MAG: hypothetical protein P4L99_25310 [Chthoniobacter sp.]|nr:hypothetical protein [Chthoniobacter sp.]